MKTKVLAERKYNIITGNSPNGKLVSINLDRVDYWKEDNNTTEVHLFNCNFSIWIDIPEEEFRKYYLNYKKEK